MTARKSGPGALARDEAGIECSEWQFDTPSVARQQTVLRKRRSRPLARLVERFPKGDDAGQLVRAVLSGKPSQPLRMLDGNVP